MSQAAMDRRATALISRCHAGLDASRLREEVLRRLRRILPVDAAFFATVDPMTLLFTSAAADEPLATATPLFLDNEFGREDVNKFAALAESADPVGSLDRATRGHRPASARYREIMGPLGLGDELRAALIAITIGPATADTAGTGAPGIIVLDGDLAVISMNPEAEAWLAEIDEAAWPS